MNDEKMQALINTLDETAENFNRAVVALEVVAPELSVSLGLTSTPNIAEMGKRSRQSDQVNYVITRTVATGGPS